MPRRPDPEFDATTEELVGEVRDLAADYRPSVTAAGLPEVVRRAYMMRPGERGPGAGHTKFFFRCRKIAQAAAPEVLIEMIALALSPHTDERVKSFCGFGVLDRAGFRPHDHDPNSDREALAVMDPSRLTPERREQLREILAEWRAAESEDRGEPEVIPPGEGAE